MTDSHVLIAAPFIAGCAALLVWVYSIANTRAARDILETWLNRHNYTLAECERRRLFKGPFFLRLRPLYADRTVFVVFRFVALDADANRHWGYARCPALIPSNDDGPYAEIEWD